METPYQLGMTYQIETGGNARILHIFDNTEWPLLCLVTAPNGMQHEIRFTAMGRHNHRELKLLLPPDIVDGIWKELINARDQYASMAIDLENWKARAMKAEETANAVTLVIRRQEEAAEG